MNKGFLAQFYALAHFQDVPETRADRLCLLAALAQTLLGLKHARVMLCGYPTPLYRPLEEAGWSATTKAVPNAMSKAGRKAARPYTVWRNYGGAAAVPV
jgi:hypothetical protein